MLIIFTINLVILGLVWPAQITFFSWTVGVTKCPSWMCVAREDTLPDFHLTPWGRPNGAIRCDCNSRGGGRTKQYVASLWPSKRTAGAKWPRKWQWQGERKQTRYRLPLAWAWQRTAAADADGRQGGGEQRHQYSRTTPMQECRQANNQSSTSWDWALI
jgi:hypothetical protein